MTNKYLVSCVLVKEKERELGRVDSSVVVLWVGWPGRQNEDEPKDAENNTRNKLVVTVQSGKDRLA